MNHVHTNGLGRKALIFAFAINVIMIGADLFYGLMMNSASLLGDAANNSGDAFIFGASLLVMASSTLIKNRIAVLKGIIMLLFGLWAWYHVYLGIIGEVYLTGGIITLIGILSLVGNTWVALMMHKHHHKDINFKSAFICCRNDAIGSAGVIVAGLLVMFTGSHWPDVVIGSIIAGITSWGGITVLRLSLRNIFQVL